MVWILFICGVVMVICTICNKFSHKFGIPSLLFFIALGMFFGTDGVFKIPFDDFKMAENICTIALIFIMFYGGFGTRWETAKAVAVKATLLSSLGVILTAFLTGLFCYFVLRFGWMESLLIGSVLSSTDAASVFSILRSKKLALKSGTAPMLEMESGSNDPWAYMLTIIILAFMEGGSGGRSIFYMVFAQLFFGIAFGIIVAIASLVFLKYFHFGTEGFDTIFVVAVAILSYALPALFGGNGYLSAYIVGIIIGNYPLKNKVPLMNFFDGMTGLMQMLVFFILGLLAFPSQLPTILLPALAIALALTFFIRPLVVGGILGPLRCSLRQIMLVSWAGLRGASSIVFAILAAVSSAETRNDVFHITFCIVLLSISFQGTLLPFMAKKLKMVDSGDNVFKTFNDYQDENAIRFIYLKMYGGHPWVGKQLKEIFLPPDMLVIMLRRRNQRLVPNGATCIQEKDILVLTAPAFEDTGSWFREMKVETTHKWAGKRIKEANLQQDTLIVMIKRADRVLVPKGSTKIKAGDILVLNSRAETT